MMHVVQSKVLVQPNTTDTTTGWYSTVLLKIITELHSVDRSKSDCLVHGNLCSPELEITVGNQTFIDLKITLAGQTVWMHNCIQNVTWWAKTRHILHFGQEISRLISICALVKRQLESRQRHLGKTEVVKVGGLYCVYRHKDNCIQVGSHIAFFVKLSIAMCSHISLTCLWVQAYSIYIVAQLGFIIQYDKRKHPVSYHLCAIIWV